MCLVLYYGENVCCAGMQVGYKNVDMTGITMHSFREDWKWKVPRAGKWNITDNVGICSKHFVKEDIVTQCTPSNDRGREKRRVSQALFIG